MSTVAPRMTTTTQGVIRAFRQLDERRYGLEICRAANMPSGVVYPILKRLERLGWLDSRWGEDIPGARRRYYQLTETGAAAIRGLELKLELKDLP